MSESDFNYDNNIKLLNLLGASKNVMNREYSRCRTCGSYPEDHELRKYTIIDGDIFCSKCGAYVRMWDAY